jgi:hypothetical protein
VGQFRVGRIDDGAGAFVDQVTADQLDQLGRWQLTLRQDSVHAGILPSKSKRAGQ